MPSTYTLISSNVLSSSAASVTFSAIPSTYTDLVLRWSARNTSAPTDASVNIAFNGDTSTTTYSQTYIYSDASTANTASSNYSNTNRIRGFGGTTGAGSTSNTFSSAELYIPNYTVSQNKPMSTVGFPETNAATFTNAGMGIIAGLYRNTAAITSITITLADFVAGSSFYLYGIKNS